MSNKKFLYTVIACMLCVYTIAQDKTDEVLYKAYAAGDAQPDVFKNAVATRKADYEKKSTDKLAGFKLAQAQFALLNSTMRLKDEDLFDAYYDDTVELIEKLMDQDSKWAEPPALLSAVYGLKMAYSPMQGMFLGPKSGSLIEKAKKLDPSSPFVMKVYANSKYFTPEMWGGDLQEAITSYEKCIQLYDAKPESLKFNWFYIDALAFMGQAYQKNNDNTKAVAAYEKALAAEPTFNWVKHSLLPKAKSKPAK
jgi:tetratricopeptide (TPR) repeat protein